MLGRTHIVCGCFAGVVAVQLGAPMNVIGFISVLAGSLAPDIDTRGYISTPGRFFPFLPKILRELLNVLGLTINFIIRMFTRHRGLTHAPLLCMLILALSIRYGSYYGVLFSLGFFSHLFLDLLTEEGIPVFYPFSKKSLSLQVTHTGSSLEEIFYWTFLILFLFLGFETLSLYQYIQ